MTRIVCGFAALLICLSVSSSAVARETEHFFDVADAVASGQGRENLEPEVAYFFDGQPHPKPASVIGTWSTRRSTRGLFRSDEAACQVAFLSALIQLQKRALSEGGDGVVDIQSITRGKTTKSPTQYRCVAGATVVHVALKGNVVRMK